MKVTELDIPGVKLIVPVRHDDARGYFTEIYNARSYSSHGLDATFVQDNQSLSTTAGAIRGLHYQRPPSAQGKLVYVLAGAIQDIAVDIRSGSATFGQHVACELTAERGEQLWIPEGFAHGFCTLEPDTLVAYKVTAFYDPRADAGIAWNDPDLAISWPGNAQRATLSQKDRALPRLKDIVSPF